MFHFITINNFTVKIVFSLCYISSFNFTSKCTTTASWVNKSILYKSRLHPSPVFIPLPFQCLRFRFNSGYIHSSFIINKKTNELIFFCSQNYSFVFFKVGFLQRHVNFLEYTCNLVKLNLVSFFKSLSLRLHLFVL